MDRTAAASRASTLPIALALLAGVATFAVRVRGVSTHFWMLRDQIRDWDAVQGPFWDLPLAGPATHVGGYTIGPAFYCLLWLVRVTVGPWVDNLPHAGGIGQAALQSTVDAVLLLAIWRRTQSVWVALAVIMLLATAAFDLSLAAVLWNPVVGSILARLAIALVLLGWHAGTWKQVATTVAVAWMAVHAYTGAIYVVCGVLAIVLFEPLTANRRATLWRHAGIVTAVIATLQLPYLWFQVQSGFRSRAMGAVSRSVTEVFTGHTAPEVAKSIHGLVGAFNFIEFMPSPLPSAGVLLVACGLLTMWRHRRDYALLSVTIVPLVLALVGYAVFLDDLDHYYYLSLMPSAVLILVLGLTAVPWPRVASGVAMAICAAVLFTAPDRVRYAAAMNRMPEYRVLVGASRVLINRGMPMRAVRFDFELPPTADAMFIFRLLGGRLDPASPWVATVASDGTVTYQDVGGV